ENDGVAVLEVLRELGEFGDLGRAHEGEVLRVEEDHLPLALEALIGDRLESRLAVFFMAVESRLDAADLEFGEFLANAEHCISPAEWNGRKGWPSGPDGDVGHPVAQLKSLVTCF